LTSSHRKLVHVMDAACYPACIMFYLEVLLSFESRMLWGLLHLFEILGIVIRLTITILLGPRVDSNRDTNMQAMLLEFCTSSHPIALKLTIDSSFFDCWLLNRQSNIDRATQGHILDAPFNQWLMVYVSLGHTTLYHLNCQMSSPCSHNCGNPFVWNSRWIVAESISHLLVPSLVIDELLFREPASIVHFPRFLQCHLVDVCCTFSSRTS